MSEYALETRLLGKEDIDFDSAGTNEQTEFTDLNGDTHTVTKLNAAHIPLTLPARAVVDGAANVDSAIQNLHNDINSVAAQNGVGMGADKTVVLETASTRQTQISAPLRNLGGHTLTFKFPEEGDVQVATAPLEFQGFYNGVLVIDLNGCDIHDNGTFSPEGVLRIKNCHCHVRIIGDGRSTSGYGKVIFTDNHYGIAIIQSPSCSIEHIAFEASTISEDFALYTESGNAFFASCTFTGCGQEYMKSIYRDYVDAHKVDAQAHAALFAQKADLVHSHTEAQVSGLVDDLAGKAPINHSHGLADISDFDSAVLDSANYASSAGWASSADYASSAGWASSALASGGTADFASSAGGLTDGAQTTIVNNIKSSVKSDMEYTGPFAVKYVSTTVGGSARVSISAGVVVVGPSRYTVASSAFYVSPGYDVYLSGVSSANGDVDFDFWATNEPTDVPLPTSSFVTKLANIRGGKSEQVQFGEITALPKWDSSGGGGTMIFPNYYALESGNVLISSGTSLYSSSSLERGSTYTMTSAGYVRVSVKNFQGGGCVRFHTGGASMGLFDARSGGPGCTWPAIPLSAGATFCVTSEPNCDILIKCDVTVLK